MSEESYLSAEELAALKETFQAQTREMLQDFGERVLELEHSSEREPLVRALERTMHTIKGDSMALQFTNLAKLAHRVEDFLGAMDTSVRPGREEIDLLLSCGDRMSGLLEAYCGGSEVPVTVVEDLCERLVPAPAPETREMSLAPVARRLRIWFAADCRMRAAGAFLVLQRLSKLGRIIATDPDPEDPAIEETKCWIVELDSEAKARDIRRQARVPGVTSRVVLKEGEAPSRSPASSSPSGSESSSPSAGSITTATDQLRVEVGKIDRIMNLVGELVIGRSMVAQALSELDSGAESGGTARARLADANGFLERTLTDLQSAVLNIRMVPVEVVFRRFPRLVRDLAHSRGKRVELQLRGGLTELDKSIVDALGEPLLHLVRNAIDHGLETPEERERTGKPAVGRLLLSAFYEGNHVHIVVEDDGRGIDVAEVSKRAVALGLVESGDLDSMTPGEILNTIYQAGFSTKDTVSDVSGRGIGMDVVRESIENLKGIIELETAPGRGTRFLIRLPLTLAILRGVLVEVASRAFAVPLTSVLEIVRLLPDRAASVLGRGVLHWRDKIVPLIPLRRALGFAPTASAKAAERAFVLLVGEAERRVGLVADGLLGEQELVIKPIDDALVASPGIAGASILGDGRIVLILHTRGLLDSHVSVSRKVEVLG